MLLLWNDLYSDLFFIFLHKEEVAFLVELKTTDEPTVFAIFPGKR